MKVLYLIDTLMGYGAETSLVQITKRFKKIKPVFVQIYEGDQLKEDLKKNGISVYSLNLNGKYNFYAAEKAILEIIDKEKPEIIHSTLFRADILGRRIKKRLPHLLLVGSLVNNSYTAYRFKEMSPRQKIKHFIIQQWDKKTAKHVDYFLSNSEAIVGPNVEALNIKKEKIYTIHRGRDFSVVSDINTETVSLPFDQKDSLIYLNVSRLENRKGHKDLIKAFSHFVLSHPSAKLLIAGEGPERKKLEELIKQLGMIQSVFLLGYRGDIQGLLKVADFFVFPTYYEGLPGSLVEAIISKTPAIVSDIPENRECFPGDEALFFPPGDISLLSKKMEQALHIEDWKTRTSRAFKYAEEKFDIERISSDYENFYESVFKKNISSGSASPE